MGYETRCRVTALDAGGRQSSADATFLIETDELIVRGDVRVKIPRASIISADVRDGEVTVRHAAGTLLLAAGAGASKLAARILAPPKPVIDKLGIAEGMTVSVLGTIDADLLAEVEQRAGRLLTGRLASASDVVLLAVENDRDLAGISLAASSLAPRGAIWAIHRKGPAGIRDTAIFAAATAAGLTYTKVARISDTHTGEKLVRPRGG